MIASAPMFFTKAESTVTTPDEEEHLRRHPPHVRRIALDRRLHDARAGDPGADEKRRADDDDDVVAEAGEGLRDRHHPDAPAASRSAQAATTS